ncbi:MAG: TIGR02680 family protein [Ktedonobacteraceae bacterium]|nr:TIGR02680 family protein [Ktedonobacteraceae bacterium]
MQKTFDDLIAESGSTNGSSEDILIRQVASFVNMLQDQAGGPLGYRLRRIILTNFWLYGQQEFEIPHGRLFLAGENASGKSTVLTAALPLGLDGDLRPNRLDTFGGRERHIEYYVLGGSESATPYNYERRTSYIALEFEWCNPDSPPIADDLRQRWENGDRERTRFLTIGLSIAGNANVTDRIRPLRFLITDGSRLGHDIDTLYETGTRHEKRAYDHTRFKQVMEGHGIICDSQADYERQVARYLFGFHDVKDFEKLINLLLILRRPNLSTELSFSRVHDYLKMSLRKISGETTSRVIGTIERIDAIQNEIERIQEAYDAAERVHRARQTLALSRAQLAGCEYTGAQLAEDAIQSRVSRLHRDLDRANNERSQAEKRTQDLQTEQYQVSGQIKALEASEGLQVATQLTSARERVQETAAQLRLQERSLESAHRVIDENAASLDRQRTRFEQIKAESVSQLRELQSVAGDEALWDVAALQLEEAQRQITTITPDAPTSPEMPEAVTMLTDVQAEERMDWLRQLEELHQRRDKIEAQVQFTRSQETTRFQELDEARRHFQSAQDRSYEAQKDLDRALEPFFAESENTSLLNEELELAQGEDDEAQSGRVVEQLATLIQGYRQAISSLENELHEAADQAQSELNELQLLTGGKMREIADIKALYEQKQAEPEYVPPRSARRIQARAKLQEQGIAAQPLYALLDFVPGISEEEAGRIEFMLEDAGLLDALVIAPDQIAAADALLAAENLGDSRLDRAAISTLIGEQISGSSILHFDSAQDNKWEAVTAEILPLLGNYVSANGNVRYSMQEDGAWTHGLLTGRAGTGMAHCIGKATRLRVRERELAELDQNRARLDDELKELTDRLAYYEQQLSQLQEKQTQLRTVLRASGIEEIYAELAQARIAVDNARGKYQKARLQTQEARQQYNALLAQLERESRGMTQLASDARRVQTALLGMLKLKNQARTLQNQLTSILHTWEEYQKAYAALERARANEINVASLYERVRSQALQAQAEMEELQRVAASSNVEELSERLQTLRERYEALFAELDTAKSAYARLDERVHNVENNLEEAEGNLQVAQTDRSDKQARFAELLVAYPVEQLVDAQILANEGNYIKAAQKLPGGELRDVDIPLRKELLEGEYRDAYTALARTFTHEQPTLLEYGPDLDDQGHVIFLNENKSMPVELMEILGDRIEMQKTLLDAEERQLFENFLLQEIAEAIRTHILEAEEWVQQINGVLNTLPMIGEHYSLQWKPPVEYDMAKLGSHLAQHYRLLRKPAQTLTTEETETLMSAFRREIEAVRLRQQENPDTNFMEVLEQVFDYREWFHFDIWVTPIGGQRQRLTDRVAGTRSGAEQLFALYVPLFAALGALYRSAAPGAPRLFALDEAFDKVSSVNTQRIMEFLVSQDFQWIMTGPQVSGAGSKIPACARYLMIHDKGSPVATASASFWSENRKNV